MAELTTLARPYAKAAFEYAQAHQQLADWSAALGVLAAVSQDDTVHQPRTSAGLWLRTSGSNCCRPSLRCTSS